MEEDRRFEQRLVALLHDSDVMMYLQEAPGCYGRGDGLPAVPASLSPRLAEELVGFLRRMAGWPPVRNEVMGPAGASSFWTLPPDLAERLGVIFGQVGTASQLWHRLAPLVESGRFHAPLVEDLCACVQREAMDMTYEAVHALVMAERGPETDDERLVANACALVREPRSAGTWPFDGAMLENLYGRLIEGVGSFSDRRPRPPETRYPEIFAYDDPRSFASIAAELSNGRGWGAHPLLGVLMASSILWGRMPFPHGNGLMEVVIRSAAVEQAGMPALRAVPLSKLRLDWERGIVGDETLPRYGSAVVVGPFGVDSTPYLMAMTSLLEQGVAALARQVDRLVEREERCLGAIGEDRRLNHRQRQQLAALLSRPADRVEVGAYARAFDVATSTARADLTGLVALGYCLTEMEGKKQVFWPRSDLAGVLLGRAER